MGVVGDGTVVAPFANAAMRLLREDWKGKYGSKMLAEELFPILQTGIPQPDQNFQNFITINAGDSNSFANLIDKFGNKLFEITAADGLKPIEPPNYPPVKLKPRIVWAAKTIAAGGAIGASELDAVAVDPETGAEIPGVYVYTPPDGTVFGSAGTSSLYVDFTPTDGVKYRRAQGRTTLTITGSPAKKLPFINWLQPDDIWLGTALSGTQLDATAEDPDTADPVPGSFVYTPPAGTVLTRGQQSLSVDFTPTDGVVYDVNSGGADLVVRGIYLVTIGGGIIVEIGDLIVVAVTTADGSGGATVAVTDSGGNSYTQAGAYVEVDNGVVFNATSIWYAFAAAPATLTITRTPSGSATVQLFGVGLYRGALAFDGTSSGSGTGGEALTAGTCPVSVDNELVVVFKYPNLLSTTFKTEWTDLDGSGLRSNVRFKASNSAGTPPLDGANVAVDPVASGTAPGSVLWTIMAASFTHRTS